MIFLTATNRPSFFKTIFNMKIEKKKRQFVSENLNINSWEAIQPYFDDLLNRNIDTMENFKKWLKDISELDAVLEEDLAWRYIKMTINTEDKQLSESYRFFISEIEPKIAPYQDKINRKIISSPFAEQLEQEEKSYFIYFRSLRKSVEIYRDENVPLISKESQESQKFGAYSAQQLIEHNGEKITMQKAATFLKEQDENIRRTVFDKIAYRRREDFKKFDDLFDELLKVRHQIAQNAGFDNYRDYKLAAMGRFDYGVKECEDFHLSVKSLVVPIVKEIQKERLKKIGKDKFKPWDLDFDPEGKAPLKPFETTEELLDKTIQLFRNIDPFFADCIQTMSKMKYLDLASKKGKAPGGYNYPLYETGVPFIFMNAVGTHRDLETMIHESGHAVHSFLTRDLELTAFKSFPSEVAELASMSMELLSMEEWNIFYPDEDDLRRAKKEQLESIIKILPWIAQVDEFQHWIYTHPTHTREDRKEKWMQLNKEYGTGLVDWTNYEDLLETSWQRQLHIFEVPFYYIEYGISQLGAIGVWKNSLQDNAKAINNYKEALSLGYTKTIPEIYQTANVSFDFSKTQMKQLISFVTKQLDFVK